MTFQTLDRSLCPPPPPEVNKRNYCQNQENKLIKNILSILRKVFFSLFVIENDVKIIKLFLKENFHALQTQEAFIFLNGL